MVTRWQHVCKQPEVIIVEESPWSYLAKHTHTTTPQTRSACHASLAPLTLPDLTICLHTSGVAIGRRHPQHRHDPEKYSPIALMQMAALQYLPQPCIFVDAGVPPIKVADRVSNILNTRVFRVESAELDGMQHLLSTNPSRTQQECTTLATKLGLRKYSTCTEGLKRLARVANILEANPSIVNLALREADRAPYYQVIHDHVGAFGLDMGDLAAPAHTPPFEIHTFGPPCHKPPIRLSPPHAKVMNE